MNHSGRVSGLSLSKELSSLAEFRSYTIEKLQTIEKIVSEIDGSIGGDAVESPTMPLSQRFGFDHDPAITRSCLKLLVASDCPLTIGQICAELQSDSDQIVLCNDLLGLVSKSLHQLARLALAVPVERSGIRKWTWTGNEEKDPDSRIS